MKISKIFAIALAGALMTACSDNDSDYNTAGDVTVSMQQSEMKISEDFSGTYYNLPVVVTGDANGPIRVTVEVTADPASPAVEDKDYVVTEKSIVIPSDSKIGNIEFYPVGDNDENPDRIFVATITKVEGAQIGQNASCIVTLLDNERLLPEAYAKVIGLWKVECDAGAYPMTVTGHAEGEDGYLTEVTLTGWHGQDICSVNATFGFDASTGALQLTMPFGQVMAKDVEFTGLGAKDVLFIGYDGQYIYPTGNMAIESNPEGTQFVFPMGMAGGIQMDGGWGSWFRELDIKMTKIQ